MILLKKVCIYCNNIALSQVLQIGEDMGKKEGKKQNQRQRKGIRMSVMLIIIALPLTIALIASLIVAYTQLEKTKNQSEKIYYEYLYTIISVGICGNSI